MILHYGRLFFFATCLRVHETLIYINGMVFIYFFGLSDRHFNLVICLIIFTDLTALFFKYSCVFSNERKPFSKIVCDKSEV